MTIGSVCLETSVVSYATSRPNRDLVIAARQQITRDWFAGRSKSYTLFASQLVVAEASGGDEEAAGALAAALVKSQAVPAQAAEDALHIAIAAVHGVEYLLTWNCKHIADATMRQAIERSCRAAGYEPPVICTPEELIDDQGI